MTYTIRIKETMQRDVKIKASSEEEALNKAYKLYYDTEIILNDNDLLDEEYGRFDCISESNDDSDYEYDTTTDENEVE